MRRVPIQGTVPPEMREAAKERARELGVSQAQYYEAVVRMDLEQRFVTSEALRASEKNLASEDDQPFIQERLAG